MEHGRQAKRPAVGKVDREVLDPVVVLGLVAADSKARWREPKPPQRKEESRDLHGAVLQPTNSKPPPRREGSIFLA